MRLTLDSLTVRAAGRRLVDELSLDVASGEVVALAGPNGSGKSTALRCVYRALRPSGGAVLLDGADLAAIPVHQSARSVAAVTQQNTVELDFTVEEIVALGRFPHRSGAPGERERRLIADAMERTDTARLAARSVLTLSGGERQRVFIARALVQEPRVLVLDEPTNHLDVRHAVALLSDLRGAGPTVLVALHDLNLAAAACDRIAVLRDGALTASGAPKDVLTPELVREVFGVGAHVVPHPATGAPQLLYDLDEGTRT
ncbi:ABC transporter ATP-binding protein [Nocardiopsis composta]|uniref:Iron complex transport system ATP-binding protein n=1 Tax=Nocardiopsis composta TaxID=157465 RepID=A0A7W8QMY1_9ACTN|nr:ABC transporter ATP-binding protein [Nocardiopsis composta]MBB5433280.1 iron complex transport system ATP-binding protein [Nocardiopsis composta]